jgi:nucleoside-diphosphate-sugar epimerase
LNPSKLHTGRNILVTGASGLLGRELVEQLLTAGEKVKAVYNKTPITDLQHQNLELVHCDLLDVIALESVIRDVSHVYHCAGLVNFSEKRRNELSQINVEATTNLVNACIDADVIKLVHTSSVAALGRIGEQKTVNEQTWWNTDTQSSVYGLSKHLGEMEVWRGIGEGLNAVIVNPSIILGAGDWSKGSTAIFKKIHDGFSWHSTGINGFVDVKDVASSMILLMNSEIHSERFIISAGNFSYQDVFYKIADAFGKPRPSKRVTPLLAAIVWRLEALAAWLNRKDPLVTKETMQTALSAYEYDSSKLIQYFPDFKYRDISETISEICAVFQKGKN